MRTLFLFIGEPHQIFHALPIAAEMAAMGREVEVAVASRDHLRMVEQVVRAYPGFAPRITLLGQRGIARWLRDRGLFRNPRLPMLFGALPFLRQFDDVVIAAALGNVKTGKLGTTDTALPGGQKIVHGSTGMSITKLLATLDILDGADNLDEGDGDRVFVWTVKQRSELLNTTEVKSADYNTVRALAEGKIDSFMGFKFKIVKRLPVVDVGGGVMVRSCVAFQRGALTATRHMKTTSMTVRDDLRNALQIYDTGLIGAARLHDEGVVHIECKE